MSALLGRIPSAVGYQPTLATDMGALQERITSTKKGSITSVQAIYVPADDLTDPAPATSFAHLDATTVLSRADRRARHLPGGGPARFDLAHPRSARGRRGALRGRPLRCRGSCSATRRCRTSSPSWAWTSCRKRTSWWWRAPARSSASCRSRSTSPRCSPARPASSSALEDTIKGFKGIVAGEYDHLPEAAFYMVGGDRGSGREGREDGGGLMADSKVAFELVAPERLLASTMRHGGDPGRRGRFRRAARPRAADVAAPAGRDRHLPGRPGRPSACSWPAASPRSTRSGCTVLAERAEPVEEIPIETARRTCVTPRRTLATRSPTTSASGSPGRRDRAGAGRGGGEPLRRRRTKDPPSPRLAFGLSSARALQRDDREAKVGLITNQMMNV